MDAVKCTISCSPATWYIVKVGDKIGIGKNTKRMMNARLKPHNAVARMKGKPFKPKMIVTHVSTDIAHLFQFQVKPYNF